MIVERELSGYHLVERAIQPSTYPIPRNSNHQHIWYKLGTTHEDYSVNHTYRCACGAMVAQKAMPTGPIGGVRTYQLNVHAEYAFGWVTPDRIKAREEVFDLANRIVNSGYSPVQFAQTSGVKLERIIAIVLDEQQMTAKEREHLEATLIAPYFTRASGDMACPICNRYYFAHPMATDHPGYDGKPFLHRLCDNRLVKL